ncbi:MAG TPA: oligosaccharide flippase family protein [Panacibacter sp.]|nr:oligosaccharide flippase family protein [Panacibacter sp.]HNP47158.1 oligosaccharide flippase family protein [Panacibacter sp.]
MKLTNTLKNILVLMSGTMIAQAVPVLVSPVLTRLYSPAELGNLALFVSIINVAGTVIAGRYEMAILSPKSHREAAFIFNTAVWLAAMGSLVLYFPFAVSEVFHLTGLLGSNMLFVLLPVSIFLFGYFNINNYLAIRNQEFRLVSSSRVIQSLSTALLQVAFGFAALLRSGLITAYLIGQSASSLYIGYRQRSKGHAIGMRYKIFASTFRRYKEYAFINAPSTLMDSISIFAPIFFIKAGYSADELGYYSLAQRLITLPTVLVGQAIAQVFLQRITSLNGDKRLIKDELFKTLKWLVLIAIVGGLGIYFLSPFLFATVFGAKWELSGELASIMSVSFFIRLIVNPVSSVFIATQELKKLAAWQTGYFLLIVLISFIGIRVLSIESLVVAYAAFDCFIYGTCLWIIFKILK